MCHFCFKSVLFGLGLLIIPGCGGGAGSTPVSTPVSTAPQNVKAIIHSVDKILITWETPPGGADTYEVQVRVAQGNFIKANSAPIQTTNKYGSLSLSLSALGAQELEELGFKVLAFKGSEMTGASSIVTVKAPMHEPSVSLTTSADGIQRLSWVNHSQVADSLRLERAHNFDIDTRDEFWITTSVASLPMGTESFLDETPPEGAMIRYRVIFGKGSDFASSISNNCFAAFRPPSDLKAVLQGQQVNLTWKNHSAAAIKVVVHRVADLCPQGARSDLIALQPGTTSFVDTPPTPGWYTYSLTAETQLWSSTCSTPAIVVTQPPANGLTLTPTLREMPMALQAVRGDSGAWFFAQKYEFGPAEVHLPKGNNWEMSIPPEATSLVPPYLSLDPQERPHTVFLRDIPGSPQKAIIHAWHDGSAWQTEEIARRQINNSFLPGIQWRLDISGALHLLWALGDYTTPKDLEYAKQTLDGSWAIEHLNLPPPEQLFSANSFKMFLDESGIPHVLMDVFNDSDRHAVRTEPGKWAWENLDMEQGHFDLSDSYDGFGQGPSDFSLLLKKAEKLCLLTKTAGVWQTAVPIAPLEGNLPFNWARSRTGDRMAFTFYASEGTKVVLWSEGVWSTHLLNSYPVYTLLAFDPANVLHLMCQVRGVASGDHTNFLNVLYDEVR